MAVIRQSEAVRLAGEAIVLDLGDLTRQGEVILARAREAARGILEQAREERTKLLADAAEEGRRQGLEQGLREGRDLGTQSGREDALQERRARLDALDQAWTAALEDISARRRVMYQQASEDVLRLAVMLAGSVVKRAIEIAPSLVVDQVVAVLRVVAQRTRLSLAVHPDDESLVRRSLPRLMENFADGEHVAVISDPALERGSCVARTQGGGEVDASIRTQLDRIARVLLPGDEVGGGSER